MTTVPELFIYYRCRAEDSAAISARMLQFQQGLRAQHPQLEARLLRRPETAADGTVTWMETYRVIPASRPAPDDWPRSIEAASAEAASPWRVGSRHVEVFEACAC